jgi:hypothetical protein
MKTIKRNDFKMIVFKQLTISITRWRTEDVFQKSSVSINAEKTNNAPNYVERFKVPTVVMVMFSTSR